MEQTTKLEDLNASYEELLKELKSDDGGKAKLKANVSVDKVPVFIPSNTTVNNSSKPVISKKKKGFFSWLLGKSNEENLELNLAEIEKSMPSSNPKNEMLMVLEKDFLDNDPIDEPRESDFNNTNINNKNNNLYFSESSNENKISKVPSFKIPNNDEPLLEYDGDVNKKLNNYNDGNSNNNNNTVVSSPSIKKQESYSNLTSTSSVSKSSSNFDDLLSEIKRNLEQDINVQNIKTQKKETTPKVETIQKIETIQKLDTKAVKKEVESLTSKYDDSLKKTDTKLGSLSQKLQDIEKIHEKDLTKVSVSDEKLKIMQDTLANLSGQVSALAKDLLSLKLGVKDQATNTSQMQPELVSTKSEQDKLKEEIVSLNKKIEVLASSVSNVTSSLPSYVKQSQFEKLKEMITQLDAYIDTFDDRERELETKYQETKELISRLELLEVQLNKQATDFDSMSDDLKNKVTFVYKYLQQVQNNIYVLSKSIKFKNEEDVDGKDAKKESVSLNVSS